MDKSGTHLLLLFLFIGVISSEYICNNIHCLCTKHTISCRGNVDPFRSVFLPNLQITHLNFRRCKIRRFSASKMQILKGLIEVDIRNQITKFNCRTLPNLPSYQILSDCNVLTMTTNTESTKTHINEEFTPSSISLSTSGISLSTKDDKEHDQTSTIHHQDDTTAFFKQDTTNYYYDNQSYTIIIPTHIPTKNNTPCIPYVQTIQIIIPITVSIIIVGLIILGLSIWYMRRKYKINNHSICLINDTYFSLSGLQEDVNNREREDDFVIFDLEIPPPNVRTNRPPCPPEPQPIPLEPIHTATVTSDLPGPSTCAIINPFLTHHRQSGLSTSTSSGSGTSNLSRKRPFSPITPPKIEVRKSDPHPLVKKMVSEGCTSFIPCAVIKPYTI